MMDKQDPSWNKPELSFRKKMYSANSPVSVALSLFPLLLSASDKSFKCHKHNSYNRLHWLFVNVCCCCCCVLDLLLLFDLLSCLHRSPLPLLRLLLIHLPPLALHQLSLLRHTFGLLPSSDVFVPLKNRVLVFLYQMKPQIHIRYSGQLWRETCAWTQKSSLLVCWISSTALTFRYTEPC